MRENEQHLLAAVTQQEAPNAQLAVGDTRFAGRYAAVDVELALPRLSDGANVTADVSTDKVFGGVYRQTRFYRETPQGWLRTQPVPSLWGQPRSIETDHLIWRYRQRDEDDVLEVAEQIDELYVQLLSDYGLTRPAGDGKLSVEVQVDYLPGHVPMQERPAQTITVPSPAVYLVPSQYATADVLSQAVGLAFLYSMWDRASVEHGARQFSAHLGGIMLWQLKQMETTLSPTVSIAEGSLLGINRLDEICAVYAVWMVRPVSYGIPIYCDAYDSGPLADDMPAPSLKYIALVNSSDGRQHLASSVYRAHELTASVIINTVIDYAVSVYGRESLPAFVLALDDHDSWETLVPAVYGVSLEEFEEAWRAHLARTAG
jgi:hypothetical protein